MERHEMITVWRAVLVTEDGDEAERQTGEECVLVDALSKARAA